MRGTCILYKMAATSRGTALPLCMGAGELQLCGCARGQHTFSSRRVLRMVYA